MVIVRLQGKTRTGAAWLFSQYCVSAPSHMSSVTKRTGSTLNKFKVSTDECNYGSPFLPPQQADNLKRESVIPWLSSAVPCIWVECF